MEAKAKYDFGATAEDELSFRRGDILKVCGLILSQHIQCSGVLYLHTEACWDTRVVLTGMTAALTAQQSNM